MEINGLSTKEIVKQIRKISGLSQKDFAHLVGATLNTIQNYEQGRRKISLETFLNYCNKINLKIKAIK